MTQSGMLSVKGVFREIQSCATKSYLNSKILCENVLPVSLSILYAIERGLLS